MSSETEETMFCQRGVLQFNRIITLSRASTYGMRR
jgi:hypothetical protein